MYIHSSYCIININTIFLEGFSGGIIWINMGLEKSEQDIKDIHSKQSINGFFSGSWVISTAKVQYDEFN